MSRLVATFFYSGLLRPAPGTWGSLAALLAAWLIYVVGGPWLVLLALGIVLLAGWPAAKAEREASGAEDPGHIVIDEVAGQWVALLPVLIGAAHVGAPVLSLWPGWIAAFVLFRLFDIWKPGPVGWADRRGDVTGLMLDDLIAGAMAAVCVVILAVLYHGVMLA
ncbi:phosphatidylglycerophosphatase A family protein [Pseudoroseicyclus aestuarii]|uniref:Phosphatidylglycerophosphatase A n=1 Tax=Pseudoroseicyclus aestuarii TaxID=1795041 RepID=A0A318SMM5_9RHOB|nr:phosphatidylglycerophosphatase A [Pseudoroseicyclus aestuarii]PYE81183.1 phosphatidylglycerophosphatase A [Pseudoroseicyclus aestuarii]